MGCGARSGGSRAGSGASIGGSLGGVGGVSWGTSFGGGGVEGRSLGVAMGATLQGARHDWATQASLASLPCASGMVNEKRVPWPGVLCTAMRPPCRATMPLEM